MVNTLCVLIIYCLELVELYAFSKCIYGIRFKSIGRNLLWGTISVLIFLVLFTVIQRSFTFTQFPFLVFCFSFISSVPMIAEKSEFFKLLSAALLLKISSMILWLGGDSVNLICYDNFNYPTALLVIDAIITAVIFVLVLHNKKGSKRYLLADHSRKELVYFICGEAALILILAVITEFSSHSSYLSEAGIPIIIFSSGIMIFIFYHMLSVKYENRYMKMEQDSAFKLLSAQESYYKMLLKKEEQTKAFRHDIRNHIYCMRTLCNDGEYEKLQEYLDDLSRSQVISNITVNSGDRLVDIIINELLSTYPDIDLRILGSFDNNHKIEQTDLCTIFSNLLTNAFEAAEKCDNKTVKLHIKRLNSNLLIKIENPVCNSPVIENNDIRTTKVGSHGYGLKNIRTCLGKYNGILELKCEDRIFEANVIIPNVLETDR